MNTRLTAGALGLAAALSFNGAQAATALGLDFPNASAPFTAGSIWNLGWSFTANTDTSVVGLGDWWDGVAYPQPQQVGLWDSSGDLLASVYITGSETPVGQAQWLFEAITPVALTAGDTYVVGAEGGATYTGEVPSVSVDPAITYVTDLYTVNSGANSPLVEPTLTESYPYGWFGANIELVPEPGTWAMMLVGLGVVGAGLRVRRRAPAIA
jgi:hypothetical protein